MNKVLRINNGNFIDTLLSKKMFHLKLTNCQPLTTYPIDDYDVLFSYIDCWKCTTERLNAAFQGIVEADGQTENAIKHEKGDIGCTLLT